MADFSNYFKFKITKLFGKYDAVIDLQKKCNVLIGANGVGKSTALKLLRYFMDGDFVHIGFVPFERVTLFEMIDDEKAELSIDYEDIFPKVDFLVNTYLNEIKKPNKERTVFDEIQEMSYRQQSLEEEAAELGEFLSELKKAGLYETFLYSAYSNKEQPNKVKCFKNNMGALWDKRLRETKPFSIIRLDVDLTMFDGSALCDEIHGMHILHGLELGLEHSAILFDLVQSFSLKNEYVYNSSFSDEDLDWIKKYPLRRKGTIYSTPDAALEPEIFKSIRLREFNSHIFAELYGNSIFRDRRDEKYKNFTAGHELKAMRSNNALDINKIINVHFFSQDFVVDVNNRARKYIEEYYALVDQIKSGMIEQVAQNEFNDLTQLFTDEIKQNFITYVKPIIVRNSFFDVDIMNINPHTDDSYFNEDCIEFVVKGGGKAVLYEWARRRCMYNYIIEVLPLCMNPANMSREVKNFYDILRKYMRDKYIEVRPSGLYIRDSKVEKNDKDFFVLYDENEIDLSAVSSGEKKLIILFATVIFGTYDYLMLDEPELSLSLVWQKSLLPDLISSSNEKTKIITATHSPYMVSAENMKPYITYLPQTSEN